MKPRFVVLYLVLILLAAGLASAQEQERSGAYIAPEQNVAKAAPKISLAAGFSITYLGYVHDPWGVGVTASGNQVYVNTPYDQQIMKYEAGNITTLMNTSTLPGANDYKKDRGFYWGDNYGNVFHSVLDTSEVKTLAALNDWGDYYPNITAVAVDPATGSVYFFDYADNNLYRVPNYDGTNTPKLIVHLSYPVWGLTIKGNLLYWGNTNGTIVKMKKSGGPITVYATGMFRPHGLAFDASGNLYVADYYYGGIARVKPGSHTVEWIASVFATPFYLAVDGKGRIYFTDFDNNALYRISRAAAVIVK